MATTTLTLLSDRVAGQTVLQWSTANLVAGDITEIGLLPATFGDCMVLEWLVQLAALTVPVANPYQRGPTLIVSTAQGNLDGCGSAYWKLGRGTIAVPVDLFAQGGPDGPVLWRQQEQMVLVCAAEDAGATADLTVTIRVQRLRL